MKNPEEVKQAADECEKKLGLPSIIINNAAGNFISPSEKLSPNAVRVSWYCWPQEDEAISDVAAFRPLSKLSFLAPRT